MEDVWLAFLGPLAGVVLGGLITVMGQALAQWHERKLRAEDRRHEREFRAEAARAQREQAWADDQLHTLREAQDALAELVPAMTEVAAAYVAKEVGRIPNGLEKTISTRLQRQAVQGRLLKLMTRIRDDKARAAVWEAISSDSQAEAISFAEAREAAREIGERVLEAQTMIGNLLRELE